MTPVEPRLLANAIRFLSIDAIVRATEGHQGVPLGMAEIATALFTRPMKFNPADPTWSDRDRFVLSNGHGSMLLYSLLYLTGYQAFSLDQIKSFRELGSHCMGHPEYDPAIGIEVTTGPLGPGIANAFGMAAAPTSIAACASTSWAPWPTAWRPTAASSPWPSPTWPSPTTSARPCAWPP